MEANRDSIGCRKASGAEVGDCSQPKGRIFNQTQSSCWLGLPTISRVLAGGAVVSSVSVVTRVLPLSGLMGASVVDGGPELALATPLRLGVLSHPPTHRKTVEV